MRPFGCCCMMFNQVFLLYQDLDRVCFDQTFRPINSGLEIMLKCFSAFQFAMLVSRIAWDGAVVRALASHQCGLGSIPICGLSSLILYSAPIGFSPGTPVFPSLQKPNFDLICVNLLISIYSVPD